MAKLGENILVLGVDEPSSPGLEWDVEAPEAIALDGGDDLSAFLVVAASHGTVSSTSICFSWFRWLNF